MLAHLRKVVAHAAVQVLPVQFLQLPGIDFRTQALRGQHHDRSLMKGDAAALDDFVLLPRVMGVAGIVEVGNRRGGVVRSWP